MTTYKYYYAVNE